MTPSLSTLPILVLEPVGRCNCRCVMCDIWKETGSAEFSVRDLEARLPELERLGVEWVVLTGGEPLMHPRLFDLCRPFRERGMRITLLTTGLLLARHASRVAVTIDEVIVSLDGPPAIHDAIRRVPGAFDALANGVRALRACRADFPIRARCTIQRANSAHVLHTTQTARDLELNSISFLAVDVASSAFNRAELWGPERQSDVVPEAACLPPLEAQFDALIASGDCPGFVMETPAKLRRILRHFQSLNGLAEAAAPVCNAPWVSAVVEPNGVVRPCFFHPPIGALGPTTTLADVLNSPTAAAFRSTLDVATNPTCRRCVCSLNYSPGSRA